MDDVIISSPSFTHLVELSREVFRLLQEAGLTLNKYKCKFGCDKLKYIGLVISKDGITTDETKVQAIVEMRSPKNSNEDGTEFAVGDIEKWFDEVRRNTKAKHEKWAKYYDRWRKRYRRDETVIPRRGAKKENPDHPMRRGHNKEDQFDPEEAENNSTAPTSRSKGQVAGVPEAEEVSNSIARRGQEERTIEDHVRYSPVGDALLLSYLRDLGVWE
ncbi:hypothetical protein TNCV_5133211 [Trichonephila clavipes]|nr:hypothetical protein TNCV_5133211 [Trichonephila clavipes]